MGSATESLGVIGGIAERPRFLIITPMIDDLVPARRRMTPMWASQQAIWFRAAIEIKGHDAMTHEDTRPPLTHNAAVRDIGGADDTRGLIDHQEETNDITDLSR